MAGAEEFIPGASAEAKPATAATERVFREVRAHLGITDAEENEEVELARANCLLRLDDLELDADGETVWDARDLAFLRGRVVGQPVNPSLWLNAKANLEAGVFKVVDGIYQVRGIDIANLTVIRSATGWIVQDCMTSAEASRAALALLERALGEPVRDRVRAVIISHSHADHFGGVAGVVTPGEVGPAEEGKVPIIVPVGFDGEAMSENAFAGPAMHRRGSYQFGGPAGLGPRGAVSTGLGNPGSRGTSVGYLPPTDFIKHDGEREVDGVPVVFQLTPDTEAPAEMSAYFPSYRAFWSAETATATLHNLYPIRGAKLRDAANWWRFTQEAYERFGGAVDVVFQSHHWPHANTAEHPNAAAEFLLKTAAAYKYIHDRTLLLANEGHTAREIAREIELPDRLARTWFTRPYYGSVRFNARAVYNKYLGFYNGNPVNLDALTEVEEARAVVDYAGGVEAVLDRAAADFAAGDYRRAAWGAEQAVYVEPGCARARYLAADAFEQLGYQAESAIWRNAYLSGAAELRAGEGAALAGVAAEAGGSTGDGAAAEASVTPSARTQVVASPAARACRDRSLLRGMPTRSILDYLGIFTDDERLAEHDARFLLSVGECGAFPAEAYALTVYAGLLLYARVDAAEAAERRRAGDAVARVPRRALVALAQGRFSEARSDVDAPAPVLDELQRISDAVVDVSAHRGFPLIEPRS